MKKILTFILVLTLVVALAITFIACDKEEPAESEETQCPAHVDADDNGKCDLCSADFEDGVECASHRDADDDGKCDICAANFDDGIEQKTAEVTFTVKLDNGTAVSGASFTIESSKKTYTLVSGENGEIKENIVLGTYTVTFDYDTIPSGCLPVTNSVEIKRDSTTVELSIIDNNPDGTAAKPFFISENVTAYSIEPGAEVFFRYRGSEMKILTVENAAITVTYKEETYAPENGVVTLSITNQIGDMAGFSLKNTSSEKVEGSFTLISPLGSMENPIAITENSFSVTVPAESAIYYSYTAEKDGVLTVGSTNPLNNISLVNLTTNAVTSFSAGGRMTFMKVTAGDVVRIAVSSTDAENEVVIDVTVSLNEGSETDPVELLPGELKMSIAPGESVSFAAQVGATISFDSLAIGVSGGVEGEDGTYTVVGEGESTVITFKNSGIADEELELEVVYND